MYQKITDTINLKNTYCIDKHFLSCIENTLKKYSSDTRIRLNISSNCIKNSYKSISEFIKQCNTLTDIIYDMEIIALFPIDTSNNNYNEVYIRLFNNSNIFTNIPGQIEFCFYNKPEYLALKSELQTLLNSHKNGYYLISYLPLTFISSVSIITFISIYTTLKDIVLPTYVPYIIFFIGILSVFTLQSQKMRHIKRFIFPYIEYNFASNSNINKRSSTWRTTLTVSIILAFVVGLLINYVSSFLF